MDGNRRFAKRLMKNPWKGHEWGAEKLKEVLGWFKEFGVKELTLYTFSVQNFNRPKKEFDYLMKIFNDNFDELKEDPKIHENEIQVNVIGRTELFPEELQKKLEYIQEKTKDYNRYKINFAMAYGGQEEIIDAAKKIAEKVKTGKLDPEDIDKEAFEKNLYMNSQPDLIIRTGGEKRISNFLAYQGAYSEYIFLDKMWPEFEKEDFVNCLKEFSERKRRFGE